MKRRIPKFKSPEEAALFWENNEVLDFFNEDEFKIVPPPPTGKFHYIHPLKKSPKRLISLRVGSDLIQKAQKVSRHQGLGYQTILRNWLEKGAKKAA